MGIYNVFQSWGYNVYNTPIIHPIFHPMGIFHSYHSGGLQQLGRDEVLAQGRLPRWDFTRENIGV